MLMKYHQMTTFKYLLPILLCAHLVKGYNRCCEGGENRIVSKKCANGGEISGVKCKTKFLINPNEDDSEIFTVDERTGSLVVGNDPDFGDNPILEKSYCLTKIENATEDVAFVCFEEKEDTDSFYTLRATCILISVIFLLLTMLVYLLVKSLRDLQGKCILNSITGLALAFLMLATVQFLERIEPPFCEIVAFTLYFAFLIAFFWLNVLSFQIWKTSVNFSYPGMLGTDKQWYLLYGIYGYGIPLVMLVVSITCELAVGDHVKPQMGLVRCWFHGSKATWVYFYGPISFLLIANIIFFLWTMKALWKDTDNQSSSSKITSLRYKCLLYLKLFFIMGLTWIFEVLSVVFENQNNFVDYIWIICDYLNMLQGVLIFLVLVVFRKRAIKGLARRGLCCFKLPFSWTTLHHDEEIDELVDDKTEVGITNPVHKV